LIGRPRAGKALAAAALPPATLPAAGFSPDLANPTPQGSVWAAIWPWGMREACVIHWSGKQGAAGDGAGSTAWSGGARSPACGAWAPLWVTGYDNSCKRKRGPWCSSPSTGLDGGVTQRRRRRAPAASRWRSFAVRALQGSSERLDPSGSLAVLLRRGNGG